MNDEKAAPIKVRPFFVNGAVTNALFVLI